ncbi:MAG: hypothetical protein Q8933_02650 [Bacteroidota bacterium]|nr:hypothetical protein [Bacteroidota bacterium]
MKRYITSDEASEIVTQLGLEFAVINNPDNVYPPFEIYPLTPKIQEAQKQLSSIVMNLEGIFASSEMLHLHSLEYMVRQISGRFEKEQWVGLDKIIDYPNLLNGSNANPVEFLIQRYHNFIKLDFFKEAYLHSALWTLILGKDEKRKEVVRKNLKDLGCGDLLNDPKLVEYVAQKEFGKYNANVITNYFLHKYDLNLTLQNFIITARAASDIYFKRVHEILELIKLGEGNNLAKEFFPGSEKLFIEPVAGIATMIAIVKGWLGGDAEFIFNELNDTLKKNSSQNYRISDIESTRSNLKRLSLEFEKRPLAIALVSTETQYDTSIIINEALNIISSQIRRLKITEERKNLLIEKFSDYRNIFDTIVTFNDISKSRQKPFRDLYSTALSQLGLHQMRFNEILGIENSENGIISMRTSGIGLTVAIPPFKSNTQNLSEASFIAGGGIPEILLNYNCFFSF